MPPVFMPLFTIQDLVKHPHGCSNSLLKTVHFCKTHARGNIPAERHSRALAMATRKMFRASTWTHPKFRFCFLLRGLEVAEGALLRTSQLKRVPSIPSIVTRVWVQEELIEYLILLLPLYCGEMIWSVLLGSLIFESEGWKGRCAFSIWPPPLYTLCILLVSGQPGGGFAVPSLYLKSVCGDVVRAVTHVPKHFIVFFPPLR